MKGTRQRASGIEYHERHSISPDGVTSERFGKPLEVPEDLEPIPPDVRPTAFRAGHPLARFCTVYELVSEPNEPLRDRPLHNCAYFDADAGIVVEFLSMEQGPDFYGVYPERARTGLNLRVEWDEEAIQKENDRRLKKAMECAGFYARVIDAHAERIEREKAEREEHAYKEAEQAAREAGSPFPTPTPTTNE